MAQGKSKQEAKRPGKKTGETKTEKYVLRLYVTGMTPKSTRAISNPKKICEEHLGGRYDLQIIDIYQQPTLAKGEQIIAAPTLIKKLPLPLRRLIGDMSNTEKMLLGLDMKKRSGLTRQQRPESR